MANRLRRQVRRLRQPRYTIALLIGAAYFGFVLLPDETRGGRGFGEAGALLGPLAVALYLAWSWLWGGHRNALAFSPAEVQHLFPAPLTRPTLIRYKLLSSQAGLVFSALLFMALTGVAAVPWWLRLPAFWVLLTTLQLHQVAASLVHTSAAAHGTAGARHHVVPITVFLTALGILIWTLASGLPVLRAATSLDQFIDAVSDLARAPAMTVLLFPFRVLLGPLLATNAAGYARAMAPALVLLVVHYIWVLRTDAAFEEGAAAAGQRRARRIQALRAGRRPAAAEPAPRARRVLFPLRPGARPASALVWKNLIGFARGLRHNTVFLALVALPLAIGVMVAWLESAQRAARNFGTVALFAAAAVALLGPLSIRNDLRRDLGHLSLIRTFPLRGRSIMAAEIASSAIVLSLAELILLLVGSGALAAGDARIAVSLALILPAAVLILPPLNALALTIQNGLALFFPDWMRVGERDTGGIEFMGQHILRLSSAMLLLGLGLAPPVLAGAMLAWPTFATLGTWSLGLGALAGIVALWIEVAIVIRWLGDVLERTDPVEAGVRA